jgi:hypothetical protein
MATMVLDGIGSRTNMMLPGCVYFYKDTINTAKIKICCIYEGVIKMYFTTLAIYDFTAQPVTENVANLLFSPINVFTRKDKCRIEIDHHSRYVSYHYEDAFQQEFRSMPDFLQSCIDESSKERIMIKMGALYETAYRPFGVNHLAAELYGKCDYKVIKELF